GINLSGGQKQRVSLARGVYNDADLYLLDDPLSAVDAHVGKHIFRHVIGPKGLLAGKTRLLVTHGITHLHKCDEIIVVSNGEIVDHGTYTDLINTSRILKELLRTHVISDEANERSDSEPKTPVSPNIEDIIRFPEDDIQTDKIPTEKYQKHSVPPEVDNEEKQKLIKKEQLETGSVKLAVFAVYFRACNTIMCLLIFVFFCLTSIASLLTNIWLSKWTDGAENEQNNTGLRVKGLIIYSGLGIAHGSLTFIMQLLSRLSAYHAGKKLHYAILNGVLHAPMSFFDTTPLGRIVNRFSKDIDSVDSSLPNSLSLSLNTMISVAVTMIILIYGSYFSIIALIPLTILFLFIQRVYVASSRQLRRLDSITRSPVYSNFSETIQGLSSIRAYNAQQRFINLSDYLLDKNQSCYLASCVTNRWLSLRLETIASLLTLLTSLFAVLMRNKLSAGTVGLTITYAMQIAQSLNLIVRMTSDIETNIVSVERINEYSQLEREAPWEILDTKPPSNWPSNGEIQFVHLSTRYRDGLELVLKDLTIDIQAGEKIGIIGRTGSGKSSLCLALFRIIEPTQGKIIIDNIDITQIGLHDVRLKITIIPQDAVIFAGTLRFNLDPFGTYTDEEIWNVLELVHLKHRTSTLENGLSYQLTEGGENLSAGEKQLLCLARALLRKSKIFVLDEATAAIDMETDRLIQQTIRSAFKDATVLTIAHRLHTILDSTRILVLSRGRQVEYDKPIVLAANPKSAFSKLLLDASISPSELHKMT
ncbi:unnamed protein product, partial [Didymodactylos carnosus]